MKRRMAKRSRDVALSTKLSPATRRQLETARARSGRSLRAEVEARLRAGLRMVDGDNMILIRLDDGLKAHVDAVAAFGLFGGHEDTVVHLIRSEIIRMLGTPGMRAAIVPHLREPWRSAFGEVAAVYEAINRGDRRS